MIEINLLPEEFRKKKRKAIELPEIPVIPIGIAFVGVLIIVQLLLGWLLSLGNRQSITLDKTWEGLIPQKTELDKIKGQIASMDKEIKVVEGLILNRISWSRVLNELSNSLPDKIWLTDLSFDEKVTFAMTISGRITGRSAEATVHMARFIKTLKFNENFFKYFKAIELISTKNVIVAGQEATSFTLVCKLRDMRVELQ